MLEDKGYKTIAKVSKKGMKPEREANFSDRIADAKKSIEAPSTTASNNP